MGCLGLGAIIAAIMVYAWWRDHRKQPAADLSDVLRGRIQGVAPVEPHTAPPPAAAVEPVDPHCEDLGRTAARRRTEIAALQELFDLPSSEPTAQEG